MAPEKPGGLPVPYGAASIDAFLEVLQGRRSIRTGFLRDKPVPDKLIEKILEAARWAPSAGNLKAGGLSLEEVARATSCTVGAVKQKASRAYERLRRLLQEETNELR